MYRTVCPNPGHDWDYENSLLFSEEAFESFAEFKLMLMGLDFEDMDEELEEKLRKQFLDRDVKYY